MAIVTQSFSFTGSTQTFSVPPFVTNILIKTWGAGGGTRFAAGGFGGPGGFSIGTLPVSTGDTLSIITGQGGSVSTASTFGGGGGGGVDPFQGIIGGSGGGRSAVLKNGLEVITAGGGGGAGSSTSSPAFSNGGSGGGLTGTDAYVNASGTANGGGKGGTQTAGGAGGVNPAGTSSNGLPGTAFKGGQGGPSGASNSGGGGGGGGGYFGGGGGIGQFNTLAPGYQDLAAGGGSSYIDGVISGSTLSTPQNTSTSSASLNLRPPNQTDPNYVAGVGLGASSSTGGNGLVVLIYEQPTLTKSVDKTIAAIGDTINYTLFLDNPGSVTLSNLTFIDTIPNGTTFVDNSLVVNGSQVSGSPNPPGVSIGDFSSSVTITFSVVVTTIPSPNPIINVGTVFSGLNSLGSNTVTTNINYLNLTASKVVNKTFANIGDILTYTIPIKNNGNSTATSINFIDTIPNGTSLVSGSFKQDNTVISGSPNPPGVTLPIGSLGINRVTTITFQVKINTIPNPNPIPNTATATSSFVIDNTTTPNRTGVANTNTNTVNTSVNFASLAGLTKFVDKSFASCGEVITYTIVAPNSGTVTALNVVFKDTIPNGTTFVTNSVYINGNQQLGANPATGVTVPNIAPGSTTTITFSVQVQC